MEQNMKQNEYILIAVVGKTDPIRSEYDGPILHIIRHYRPERVLLILSEEIGRDEREYHYNEKAIHLLDENCQVETVETDIRNPHSYDDFSTALLEICNRVQRRYPQHKILLDITSGTPQMETALCMIAMADLERFVPIQVPTPVKAANKSAFFQPKQDLIEEWFEMDLDNEPGAGNRCRVPHLLNFKRPMIQFQITALIKNYDYEGACQLYNLNRELFSENTGLLLQHARRRLNLEFSEAEELARELGMRRELYFIRRTDVRDRAGSRGPRFSDDVRRDGDLVGARELVEFYNSMHIKQIRGELNDFALRMEIMTEYTGLYILESHMRIRRGDIAYKDRNIYRLSREKCERSIPGISKFLDQCYSEDGFRWGNPLSSRHICYIVEYICQRPEFAQFQGCVTEMLKWVDFSARVRNPAAHTIVAITENEIREAYNNEDSATLCRRIRTVLTQILGKEAPEKAFEIYDRINDLVVSYLKNERG